MFDLILKNGTIYDGNGGEPYKADLAVKDGKIIEISHAITAQTVETIDVADLAVAPGFIDIHSHGDCTFLIDDKSESKITQGVTSEVTGQCGATIYPCKPELKDNLLEYVGTSKEYDAARYTSCSLQEFIDKATEDNKKMSTNIIPLIGHGALRCGVLRFEGRPASESELKIMCELMKEQMDQGAWGMSLGLGYTPGIFADQNELNELGKVISKYDGIITSHMRNQATEIFEALNEMYEINRQSGCKVHIAHLKRGGKSNYGTAYLVAEDICKAAQSGIRVSADMYPYNASSTGITNILPKWSLEGGVAKAAERLATTHKEELMASLEEQFKTPQEGKNLFVVSTDGAYPLADGKNIYQISEELGLSMAETVAKIIIETNGATRCIFFSMDPVDVDFLLRQNWISIGSDGSGYPMDYEAQGGKLHPRNFGTFPRVLALARDEKICSMAQAVRRMTRLPADIMGISDRGVLQVGKVADITVFDPNTVKDMSTFEKPYQAATGIVHVLMDGKLAIYNTKQTENRLGQFILKK